MSMRYWWLINHTASCSTRWHNREVVVLQSIGPQRVRCGREHHHIGAPITRKIRYFHMCHFINSFRGRIGSTNHISWDLNLAIFKYSYRSSKTIFKIGKVFQIANCTGDFSYESRRNCGIAIEAARSFNFQMLSWKQFTAKSQGRKIHPYAGK